jgi:hypothetical protein
MPLVESLLTSLIDFLYNKNFILGQYTPTRSILVTYLNFSGRAMLLQLA